MSNDKESMTKIVIEIERVALRAMIRPDWGHMHETVGSFDHNVIKPTLI